MEDDSKTDDENIEGSLRLTFAKPPGLDLTSTVNEDDDDALSSSPTHHSHTTSRWDSPSKSSKHILRQSAYMISVISERSFIQRGAVHLQYGIYYIRKEYCNTPEGETVALVGIPMIHIQQFFVEESELIREVRKLPQLAYISNVSSLCATNTCDILKKFNKFFENCDSNSLVLLNIEPRGEGRYKRLYPFPRFTIPGGTMEARDSNDFLQCALREFKEETSLDISESYELISQKKIVRDIRVNRRRQVFNYFNDSKPCKIISKYFFVRVRF